MGYWPCQDCHGRGSFGFLPRWLKFLPLPRGWFIGTCPRCNGDKRMCSPPPMPCPLCGEPRAHHLDSCERCGWERPISPAPPKPSPPDVERYQKGFEPRY